MFPLGRGIRGEGPLGAGVGEIGDIGE